MNQNTDYTPVALYARVRDCTCCLMLSFLSCVANAYRVLLTIIDPIASRCQEASVTGERGALCRSLLDLHQCLWEALGDRDS